VKGAAATWLYRPCVAGRTLRLADFLSSVRAMRPNSIYQPRHVGFGIIHLRPFSGGQVVETFRLVPCPACRLGRVCEHDPDDSEVCEIGNGEWRK
jgi:hypothetical protein